MDKIDLSVIIVTYNSSRYISDCIDSIFKHLSENTEIIILDNNSQDDTVNRIKRYKKVKLLEQGENFGFSKACNIGAKVSSGEYLFFLNPDTEIISFNKKELFDFLNSNSNLGILVPKLIKKDGKTQPSVLKTPTILGAFLEYYLGMKESYKEYAPTTDNPIEVENAYGAAYIIKKDFFESIGGFDERYFLYFEDLDLCRRVRKMGKKIIYYPYAKVRHVVGGSSKSILNILSLHKKSAILYYGFLKYHLLTLILKLRPLRRN